MCGGVLQFSLLFMCACVPLVCLPRAYVVCGGVFGMRVRTYIPRYLFASVPSEWLAPTTAGIKFGAEDNSALLLTTFAKLDSTLLGGKLTSYVYLTETGGQT